MKKTVSILGATGSIGKSTISLLLENPEKFEVVSITANGNAAELAKIANIINPKYVAVADETKYAELKNLVKNAQVVSLAEAASAQADIVISAIVGIAGLKPTMAAINNCKILGLANKESMVCAGQIMLDAAKKSGTKIIPIDSEHNAIAQVLEDKDVENIVLTASGGPFLNYSAKQLENVTAKEAIKHPKWDMGAKISVDSATMMNKGLEVIEAHYLFNLPPEKINVVIHPESIIHSMVNYADGASLAQLSWPDMRVPISYVLGYPKRLPNSTKRLDLAEIGQMNFAKPDYAKFSCLQLGYNALKAGAAAQIVLNATNEVAVDAFLNGRIKFLDIPIIIEKALQQNLPEIKNLENIFELDNLVRKTTIFQQLASA